jgi:7-cyano-7-deazaguanine synthase
MRKAVVLLSGGIDSSTSLAIAQSEGFELYALSFDYSQRHKRELESARLVAASLRVRKHLVIKADLSTIGGSALTSEIEVPKRVKQIPPHPSLDKEGDRGGDSLSSIPVTYVPARNTIFLSFSLGWAEVLDADSIFIGANAIDYSGYPDCRPEFLRAFQDMANLATKASVEEGKKITIKAPLLFMKKSEIIIKGVELGLDYALTWSCYDPQGRKPENSESKKVRKIKSPSILNLLIPCGACDSCVMRAKGFQEAGIADPLLT